MDIITNANGEIVLLTDGNAIGLPTQQAIQLKDKFSISSEQWEHISNPFPEAILYDEFTYSFIDSKNKQYVLIPQDLDSNKNYFVYTDKYSTDSWYKKRWYKSIKIKYDSAVKLKISFIDSTGQLHQTLPGYQVIFINWQGEEKVAATAAMFNNSIHEFSWNTNTITYFSDLVPGFPDYTFFVAEVDTSANKVVPAIIDFTDTTLAWINLLLLNKKQIVES